MMKSGLQRIEATLSQLHRRHPQPSEAEAGGAQRPAIFPGQTALPLPSGFQLPALSNPRHATDPALALGLLREIESTITGWQKELQRILLTMQELQMEGAIVDGWLESQPQAAPPFGANPLRHAEINQLLDYVRDLCKNHQPQPVAAVPRAGYWLCGLDADGQVWSFPCPAEQVPQISLAIARCQKMRQLVERKNYLETRLSQLAETLVSVHSQLRKPEVEPAANDPLEAVG
jgi:hypothetical protein